MTSDYFKTQRTRVKICGITRPSDMLQAALLGADAVGFVFYEPSKRYVTPVRAAELTATLPAFLNTVALFVNPTDQDVETVISIVSPGTLQFHGDESSEQCLSYGLPYLKAFRVGAPGLDTCGGLVKACLEHPHAAGWLFDSFTPVFGGSGATFDYSLLDGLKSLGKLSRPFILSGGLNAQNVLDNMGKFIPWAVDVSSGVEVSPGMKSTEKMREFINAIRAADNHFR